MPYRKPRSRRFLAAAFAAGLWIGCAHVGGGGSLDTGVSNRLSVTQAFALTPSALRTAAEEMLTAFGAPVRAVKPGNGLSLTGARDSTDSADYAARHFETFLRELRGRGLTVARLRPGAYESLYALSGLPVLIGALVLHFPDRRFEPLDKEAPPAEMFERLVDYAPFVRFHVLAAMQHAGETYIVTTRDGIRWQGLARERLAGQVIPIDHRDTRGYGQIVGHFIFSSLPTAEIRGHIDEWYDAFPHAYVRPSVVDIR